MEEPIAQVQISDELYVHPIQKIHLQIPAVTTLILSLPMVVKMYRKIKLKPKQGKGRNRKALGQENLLNLPGIAASNTYIGKEMFRTKELLLNRLVGIAEINVSRNLQKRNTT